MSTTIVEKPLTLVRGLFQVRKTVDNSWTCNVVIYGAEVRFTPVQMTRVELESLLAHFNVTVDWDAESSIAEFMSESPMEKLAQVGITEVIV
ncbi:MAG TPA: hypothetical protein V6C97_35205 [Oculatellaceae cyanobacterium]